MTSRDEVACGLAAVPASNAALLEPAGAAAPSQSHTQPYRVALFGFFGSGNFGNDGSLEAMLQTLRRAMPEAELVCICHDCDVVNRNFGIATLPISRPRAPGAIGSILNRLFLKLPGKLLDAVYSLRRIHGFDAMIFPGTGILDDFGERPTGMPLDLFRWCLAARLHGVKIAFVSIGAGPIVNPASRWLMLTAARLAHYRTYRDQISKEYMTGYGLDTRGDLVFPDIAFKLPAPARTGAESESGRPVVGVGVMNYRGWYRFVAGGERIYAGYIGKLTQFVRHLVDSGYDVRLLIGDLDDEDAIDIIQRAIRAARPDLPQDRLQTGRCNSLHDVMNQISGTDFVVATRFHNIVCALKLGKPTISLGYAKKNDVLMEKMGLGAFCQHIEHFEVPVLIDQFNTLVDHRSEYERRVREQAASFIESLDHQDRTLLRILAPAN